MIILAELNDMKDGMAKAYENFAKKTGYDVTENTMFNCTKIEVSKEIDDYFWKYYRDKAKNENPNLTEDEIKTSIAMLMLMHGAKRNENLDSWTVDIQDEFAFESN